MNSKDELFLNLRVVSGLRSFSKWASIFVIVIGMAVIFGWIFNISFLKSIHPSWMTLKPVSALSFIISGISLFFLNRESTAKWEKILGVLLASFVLSIGLFSLLEYFFTGDLLKMIVSNQKVLFGRMAPVTALNFTLFGISLLTARRKSVVIFGQVLAMILLFISIMVLVVYFYGVHSLYSLPPFGSFSFHSALLFVFLSTGLLATSPEQGLMTIISNNDAGGILARRLLPFTIIIPIFFGWVRLMGEKAGYYGFEFGLALFSTSNVITFFILILLTAYFMNKIDFGRRKAEALSKELEMFSYSVSHDLRAPLRAIDGFSRIISETYSDKLNKEGIRLFNIVRKNTQNMGKLIDDLLAFSRFGRSNIEVSKINVEQLVKSVIDELKPNFPEKTFDVIIHELPRASGDTSMIKQVWVNLISNAFKFSQPNHSPKIEVGSFRKDNEIVYYVRDNGVGFDMKYADKLFGVFQRLHSTKEFEGTGVGLANVQRIIHRHGGTVWAEANVGDGAIFYFTIGKVKETLGELYGSERG
ncbi:MAG TPA: ATP-binding protein [Bdellovibrionota bacterium]|nr:ATP-binding protein [Bdellovibrionota bacterium]